MERLGSEGKNQQRDVVPNDDDDEVVNQFTMSMSVYEQQCTLLRHTPYYKHCDPSIQ